MLPSSRVTCELLVLRYIYHKEITLVGICKGRTDGSITSGAERRANALEVWAGTHTHTQAGIQVLKSGYVGGGKGEDKGKIVKERGYKEKEKDNREDKYNVIRK